MPADNVQAAVESGQFSLPKGHVDVISPEGEKGTIPAENAAEAFKAGYKYASPTALKELKRGTLQSHVESFAQGVNEGIAGPLAVGAQKALGDSNEVIRERKEAHPYVHGLGEAVGLAGGLLTGTGEAALLSSAGKLAAKSMAKRAAIENALYAAGDEVSKMLVEDPHQSVESAITNVGLAGALGGALGKAGKLVNQAADSKLGSEIAAFRDQIGRRMDPRDIIIAGHLPEGAKIADQLIDKGAAKLAGGSIGATVGAGLGGYTGATVGGLLGERFGDKILPGIAKSLLKNEVSAGAYKAASQYITDVIRGQTLLNKAAQSVFKAGTPDIEPTEDHSKLKDTLDDLKKDFSPLLSSGENLSHYLPDHSGALGESLSRVVSYLAPLKPATDKAAPLSPERIPSKAEEARYTRALDIAEQPLIVTKAIKEGSLTPFDVESINAMYPAVANQLRAKLLESMTQHLSGDQGSSIPYKTAMALSLFFGMPLDPSISPASIMSLQTQGQPMPPPQGLQPEPSQGPKKGLAGAQPKGLTEAQGKGLQTLPAMGSLPGQSREASRSLIRK